MSPAARDSLDLALCVLFAAGFFYYYVAGVVDENRALSRSARWRSSSSSRRP